MILNVLYVAIRKSDHVEVIPSLAVSKACAMSLTTCKLWLIAGMLIAPFTVIGQGVHAADAPSARTEEPTLERLLAAWTERQAQLQSVIVRWTEDHVDFENSISRSHSPDRDERIPAEKSEYSGTYELKLSGQLSIYQYDGQQMRIRSAPEKSTYVPFKSLEAFDGHEGRSLRMITVDDEVPVGIIQREDLNPDGRNAGHAPLAWFCRPMVMEMGGFDAGKLDLMSSRMERDGIECMVLLDESFSAHTQVWVAPSLDYSVVGVAVKAGKTSDRTTWEIWVSYDRNPEGLVVPKSWVFDAATSSGEKLWHISSTITDLQINVPIDEKEFRIEFPATTLVHDLKHDKKYLVDPEGSTRPLNPQATGRTYQQLRAASTRVPTDPPSNFTRIVLVLNVVAVSMIVGWMLYLRRTRARST